jgi:hypothetical protein
MKLFIIKSLNWDVIIGLRIDHFIFHRKIPSINLKVL